jgi:hypothetical protein
MLMLILIIILNQIFVIYLLLDIFYIFQFIILIENHYYQCSVLTYNMMPGLVTRISYEISLSINDVMPVKIYHNRPSRFRTLLITCMLIMLIIMGKVNIDRF